MSELAEKVATLVIGLAAGVGFTLHFTDDTPDHVADASKMVAPTPIPWRPDDFAYDDARTIRYAFERLGLEPAFDMRANDDGLTLIYRDGDGRRMEVLMPPFTPESVGVEPTGRGR